MLLGLLGFERESQDFKGELLQREKMEMEMFLIEWFDTLSVCGTTSQEGTS